MQRKWLLLLTLLAGCSDPLEDRSIDHIRGRSVEQSVYSFSVPSNWERRDPSCSVDLMDTKQSLCEFFIRDTEGDLRITFHNFPSENLTQRVPPLAQLNRWKGQLNHPDPASIVIEPVAWAGFSGYRFEGTGKGSATLGWAMQLASEHYYSLSSPAPADTTLIRKEMRADFTIKATGPAATMRKYTDIITRFAETFELTEDIPNQ